MAKQKSKDAVDKIYKFTSADVAKRILSNRSILCSRPSSFNDAFDVKCVINEKVLEEFAYALKALDCLSKMTKDECLEGQKSIVKKKSRSKKTDEETINLLLKAKSIMGGKGSGRNEILEFAKRLSKHKNNFLKNIPFSNSKKVKKDLQNKANFLVGNSLYVGCFSTKWETDAMWGLYADKNKGACLELSIPKEEYGCLRQGNVTYTSDRPTLSKTRSKNLLCETVSCMVEKRTKIEDPAILNSVLSIAFSKSIRWSYEKEYRVVYQQIDGEKKENENSIAKRFVIRKCLLGPKISNQDKEDLNKYSNDVEVFETEPSPDKYEMIIKTNEGTSKASSQPNSEMRPDRRSE